jgi:predicted SAM-dependent methyltransferase
MNVDAIRSPSVSIVLPAFDAGSIVIRAIESIRRQTIASWELLVLLDSAAGAHCAVLERFVEEEERLRVISCELSIEVVARSLRTARAPLVTYLDCEHEFHPEFLERILAWESAADVLVCGWDLAQEPSADRPRIGEAALDSNRCYDRLMSQPALVPAGLVHRREMLERTETAGWDPQTGRTSNPWWRLAEAGTSFLPVPIQAGVWHVPNAVGVAVPPPTPLPPPPASVTAHAPMVLDEVPPWGRSLLRRHGIRGLHCGCGPRLQPGWVNTDRSPAPGPKGWREPEHRLVRVGAHYYYLRHDATRRFPFDDQSFDWVYSEHFLEHVTRREGVAWLREVRRLLAPGGVARITTPDLARYIEGYSDPQGRFFAQHARRLEEIVSKPVPKSRAWMVNQIFFAWGHRWVYDFDELREAATEAGFSHVGVRRREFRDSAVRELAAMDQERRSDESLYVELSA